MKTLNRNQLDALNGSETAIRTVKAYRPIVSVALSSKVKGSGNRPPSNDNVKGHVL